MDCGAQQTAHHLTTAFPVLNRSHVHTHHSWRDPPEHSFSDWTLVAASSAAQSSSTAAVDGGSGMPSVLTGSPELMKIHKAGAMWASNRRAYCVHKIFVAHGHRASLFLRDEMIQPIHTAGKTTTLELPTLCVGCMELLLDYVYEDKLELTKANMLPMLLLARMLRVNNLGTVCTAFIREHMKNARQAPFIYALAIELGLAKIEQASAAIAATHFSLYSTTVFEGYKLPSVLAITSHPDLDASADELCAATAEFIKYLEGEDKLRQADFDALVKVLPSVVAMESVYLLTTAFALGSMAFAFVCFEKSLLAGKTSLPVATFVTLLGSDHLRVQDEDTVLELILSYIAENKALSDDDQLQLWRTCRFLWCRKLANPRTSHVHREHVPCRLQPATLIISCRSAGSRGKAKPRCWTSPWSRPASSSKMQLPAASGSEPAQTSSSRFA